MPPRLDGVLWQLVLITIQMLSPCMSVHMHMCGARVYPQRTLIHFWFFYLSCSHGSSRSRVTFLKGVCEFSCVTWTTIAAFRQQCVKSPVNIIISSNVRFETMSLYTAFQLKKKDKEKVKVSRDRLIKISQTNQHENGGDWNWNFEFFFFVLVQLLE